MRHSLKLVRATQEVLYGRKKEAPLRRIVTIFHRFGKRHTKEVKKMVKEQLEEYSEDIASLQIERDEINEKIFDPYQVQ